MSAALCQGCDDGGAVGNDAAGAPSMTGGVSNGGSAGNVAAGGTPANGGSTTGGALTGGAGASAGTAGTNASGAGGSSGSSAGGSSGAGGSGGTSGSGGSSTGGSSGAGGSGGSASVYRPCPTDGSPCKVMPFGDSITDGFGTVGAYRVELFRLAHQAGKNITFVGKQSNGPSQVDGVNFPPQHEGHSGYTIENIGGRTGIAGLVATVIPELKPHIITLMIGTNDAIDNADLPNAPTRLGKLIDSIYALLPDVLIIVAQPIPSQDADTSARIQIYNATLPAVVKTRADAGRHIELVDMYGPFSAQPNFTTTLLKDTWHPNEAGHVILGATWYKALAPHL